MLHASICAPFQNVCLVSVVLCFVLREFLSGFVLLFARSKPCTCLTHVIFKDRTAGAGGGEGIERDERRKEIKKNEEKIKSVVMAS